MDNIQAAVKHAVDKEQQELDRFLVLGTHVEQGGVYVWCGADGFIAVNDPRIEGELSRGQLINRQTAERLMARASENPEFAFITVPVRDIPKEDKRIILLS